MMSETIKRRPVAEPKVDVEGEWRLVTRKQKKKTKRPKAANAEADLSSQINRPWRRRRGGERSEEQSPESSPGFKIDLDKDFPPLSRAGLPTWWEERKPTVQTLDSTDEAQVGLGLSRILQEDNNWTPQPPAPKLVPREPEQEPAEARDRSQRSADEEFITVEELQEDLCRLLRRRSSSRKTVEWLQANVDEDDLSSHEFLEILVVCLCKCELVLGDAPHVEVRSVLRQTPLLRFFVRDEEKQMTALRALGEVMTCLNHPDGLLNMLLDILVDEDVVQEDTFIRWKSFEDQRGNGELLGSVAKFFSYLTGA